MRIYVVVLSSHLVKYLLVITCCCIVLYLVVLGAILVRRHGLLLWKRLLNAVRLVYLCAVDRYTVL